MSQLHKRFSSEQVKMILNLYIQKKMEIKEVLNQLEIKERRFYKILAQYKKDKVNFSIEYGRDHANYRITGGINDVIKLELEKEKSIIENKAIPVTEYNYSAIRDEVVKTTGQNISVPTIINRAKEWEYYIKDKPKKRLHDREVITDAIGMLMQYDSSHHLWSPFAKKKWTLITNLDLTSRH